MDLLEYDVSHIFKPSVGIDGVACSCATDNCNDGLHSGVGEEGRKAEVVVLVMVGTAALMTGN